MLSILLKDIYLAELPKGLLLSRIQYFVIKSPFLICRIFMDILTLVSCYLDEIAEEIKEENKRNGDRYPMQSRKKSEINNQE